MNKTLRNRLFVTAVYLALVIWTVWVLWPEFIGPDDKECGRSMPPACAEMGTCVYNYTECRYEELNR